MAQFVRNEQGKLYLVNVGNDLHMRDRAKVQAKVAENEYRNALEIFANLRDVTFGSHGYAFTADYLKLPPLSPELREVARLLYLAAEVFFGIANDSIPVAEATNKLRDLVASDDKIGASGIANRQFGMAYTRMTEILIDLARP